MSQWDENVRNIAQDENSFHYCIHGAFDKSSSTFNSLSVKKYNGFYNLLCKF